MMSKYLWLPLSASEHASKIDQLIVYLHVLMGMVFVGWAIFFFYTLVRFRRKRNPKADYEGVKSHASSFMEAIIIVVEIVLLIGFSIPFWVAEVDALPGPEKNAFEVRVLAQQYAWNVHYPGADGIFGATGPEHIEDGVNIIGLDPKDANGKDDIVSINQLHLPVGRPALIHLTTMDVIHSFALPEFRVKQDAIPGMSIPVHFTPTMTTTVLREQTDDPGRSFEIACAQLCGLAHYRMRGYVTVETEAEVQAWLDKKRSKS